jgi:O-antigen ligase
MRSQSYQQAVPLAPGRIRPGGVAARPIPSLLYWLVALAVGSSFYVAIEPAPTDLIFLILFAAVLLLPRIRFPLDLNPVLGGGLLVFLAASVLSLLWSQDMERGVFYLSVTLYLLAAWFVVVSLLANYGPPMSNLIMRAFLIAATIVAVIGLIGHFSTVLQDYLYLQTPYGERARGTFKDPNVYAPYLVAALLLVINRMITRRVLSPVMIALLCLFALETLGAFSRGAYVNLAVALAVYFALQLFIVRRRDWLVRACGLLGLSLVVLVPVVIVFLQTTELDDFLSARLRLQHYDAERFGTQALAVDMFSESPLGIGPGQSERQLPISTHNLYLRIAIENGLFALLGFCAFLASTLWICLRGVLRRGGPFFDLYACSLAILAGMLVNSLVIDSLHWRHLFLFLAIPVGLWQCELRTARAAAARPAAERS